MALVRMLVDGYSLLHSWPAIARRKARHSAAARDELVRALLRYHDITGAAITVIFDGTSGGSTTPMPPGIEVLYSRAGQTADQMIERATQRLLALGEVLVVSDDRTERDVVTGFGAMAWSCRAFIQEWESAVGQLQRDLKSLNLKERNRFRRARTS